MKENTMIIYKILLIKIFLRDFFLSFDKNIVMIDQIFSNKILEKYFYKPELHQNFSRKNNLTLHTSK